MDAEKCMLLSLQVQLGCRCSTQCETATGVEFATPRRAVQFCVLGKLQSSVYEHK